MFFAQPDSFVEMHVLPVPHGRRFEHARLLHQLVSARCCRWLVFVVIRKVYVIVCCVLSWLCAFLQRLFCFVRSGAGRSGWVSFLCFMADVVVGYGKALEWQAAPMQNYVCKMKSFFIRNTTWSRHETCCFLSNEHMTIDVLLSVIHACWIV